LPDYVTDPVKIKLLLAQYPILEAMLANLIIELEVIYKQGTGIICTSEEIMEALAMSSDRLSDMPRSAPAPGDKITNIIADYQKILDSEYGELLMAVRNDVFIISSVVDKIQNAIKRLPDDQKEVLTLKYWQQRSWGQIADAMRVSEGQAKRWHKIAVEEHLRKALKIGYDSYNYVMEKVRDK